MTTIIRRWPGPTGRLLPQVGQFRWKEKCRRVPHPVFLPVKATNLNPTSEKVTAQQGAPDSSLVQMYLRFWVWLPSAHSWKKKKDKSQPRRVRPPPLPNSKCTSPARAERSLMKMICFAFCPQAAPGNFHRDKSYFN